jgi:UDP-N-acetylglucosamine transferase subunit ALG13
MARRAEFREILDNHQVEFLQHLASRRLVVPVSQPSELLQRINEARDQTESGGPVAPVRNVLLQEAIASILLPLRH